MRYAFCLWASVYGSVHKQPLLMVSLSHPLITIFTARVWSECRSEDAITDGKGGGYEYEVRTVRREQEQRDGDR